MTDPTNGDRAARAAIDEGLQLLRDALGPVLAQRLANAYGPGWMKQLGFERVATSGRSGVHDFDDPLELLRLVVDTEIRDRVYPELRADAFRVNSLARPLIEARHQLAHYGPLGLDAAWRTLDQVRSLLDLLQASTPTAVHRLEELTRSVAALVAGPRDEPLARLRDDYREMLLETTRRADLAGLPPQLVPAGHRPRLDAVYVAPTFAPWPKTPGEVNARQLIAGERVVVLGDPGAGKSTFLRWVARQDALDAIDLARTPVIVQARELAAGVNARPGIGLRQYLVEQSSERYGELYANEIARGRMRLLVDGLDEVEDGPARAGIVRVVAAFAHDFPSIPILVTSRAVGYNPGSIGPAFAEFRLSPLDKGRVDEVIDRWARAVHPDLPESDLAELVAGRKRDLAGSKPAEELARTPLLLTLILLLWEGGVALPARRAELYGTAVQTLLREWPRHRGGTAIDALRLQSALGLLAYSMLADGASTIGEGDVRTTLHAWLSSQSTPATPIDARQIDAVVGSFTEETGVLAEAGYVGPERTFAFLHRSLAEYLAAVHLGERWRAERIDLEPYMHESRWSLVMSLLMEHVATWGQEPASAFVRALRVEPGSFEGRLGVHGDRGLEVLAAGGRVADATAEILLDDAVRAFLDPTMASERWSRAKLLAGVARERGAKVVEEALRRTGARGSGALAAALRVQLNPDDEPVRIAFVRAWAEEPDAFALNDVLIGLGLLPRAAREVASDAAGPWLLATPLLTSPPLWRLPRRHWFFVPDDVAEGLRGTVASVDLKDASSWSSGPKREFGLIDLRGIDRITWGEFLELLSDGDPAESAMPWWYVIPDGWLSRHVADIRELSRRAQDVSASVAMFAIRTVVLAKGSSRDAWHDLLTAVFEAGRDAARRKAFVGMLATQRPWFPGDRIENLLAAGARDADPGIRSLAASAMSDGEADGTAAASPLLPDLYDALRSDSDPQVRGATLRGDLANRRYRSIFSIIANPDLFRGPVYEDEADDDTPLLLDAIAAADTGDLEAHERAVLIEAGTRLLRLGGRPPGGRYWYVDSADSPSPALEAAARAVVADERWQARGWAAWILLHHKRAAPAGDLIARLLADDNPWVADLASGAVSSDPAIVEASDDDWLFTSIHALANTPNVGTAGEFGWELRDRLSSARLQSVREYLELLLDERPDSPGAHAMARALCG